MTCSPNKLAFRSGLFLAFLSGSIYLTSGAASISVAQEAGAEAGPVDTSANNPEPQISSQTAQGSDITVDALGQVDPSSVGLIDQSSGGFPPDMWARSDRPLIELLISQLPMASHSLAMQGLLRRTLLTAAVVPAGEAGTPGLLALRLKQLARGGDLADTVDLLDRLPADTRDSDILKLKVNAMLLTAEPSAGCNETANLLQIDPDPYWTEVLGYCHVLKGDMAAAALVVEMLQDRSVKAPLYFQLMAKLTGADTAKKIPIDLGKFNKPDPLLISMLQTAGLDIPAAILPNASPLMVQALAANINLPIDLRVEAAEKAARNGSLTPEKLAEIYGAVTFTPEEREKVLELASTINAPYSARVNALLYQMAGAAVDIQNRGPILQAIWARARKLGMLSLQARVNAGAVSSIEPSAEALPYVNEIARLLLLAGKYDRFAEWYELMRLRVLPDDKPSTDALLALWPLATMADTHKTLPWSADVIDQWWKSQVAGSAQDRGTYLFSLLGSLGYQVPDAAWVRLMEGAPIRTMSQPTLPYQRALMVAAKDKRLGEVVLLSLISLGDSGAGKASPETLGNVIAALDAVGLDSSAREIAIEALVARDF